MMLSIQIAMQTVAYLSVRAKGKSIASVRSLYYSTAPHIDAQKANKVRHDNNSIASYL